MKEMNFKFRLTQLLDRKYNSTNRKHIIIIIVLLFSSAVLLGVDSLNKTTDLDAYDTAGYLGEANFISTHGGVTNFINLCFNGTYKQANQHPLLILFLTPFASIDISFFIIAKIISFTFGIIFLLSLFLIGRRMFGDLVASVAVLAMIFNVVFMEWTALVACESLLMLLSLLCMYLIIEGFHNNKNWAYAGIFAGLSFLTKASGLILIPGFVVASFVIYKFKIFKNKYFWSFFVLFFLIASPLLIRNIIVYNDPFFNVNKYVVEMGVEEIDNSLYSIFSPNIGAGHWRFEKIEKNKINDTNETSFFDLTKISRFLTKLITESDIFLDTINISWVKKVFPGKLVRIFELLLFIFFLIGIVKEKKSGTKIYILVTLAIFFSALFFNPISRYFLPVIPLIWLYIAFGIFIVLDIVNEKLFKKSLKIDILSYIPHFLIILLILNFGYILFQKKLSNPLESVDDSESRMELVRWARNNIQENDIYALGPNLNWQLKRGTCIFPPKPAHENFSKLNSFIKNHNILFVIIGRNELTSYRGRNYYKLTQEYFEWNSIEGIIAKENIDNWSLVYKDEKKPIEYLVYKIIN